jgi:AraC-like DNA-binding protein
VHRTLKAVFLNGYIEIASSIGLDPYAILTNAHIDPRWLEDPQRSLPVRSIVRIFEVSAKLSGRDDLGLLLGQRRTFASIGPVALLLQHEPTIRAFLKAAIKYRTVLEDAAWMTVDEVGTIALLRWELMSVYSSTQLMDYILAASTAVLNEAGNGRWHPSSAHFRHAAPKYIETFQHHFKCPLEFNDSFDGLTCAKSALDIKIPSADPTLASHARQLLDLRSELRVDPPVTDYVRNAIRLLIHHGSPTLDRVGRTLGVSARSVQRRLASEGQSFEKILNDVRRDLATAYLASSDRSITDVASDVGFTSLSSLERWFKTQFGTSPMKWRKVNGDQDLHASSAA